jgi:methionyl-tRNA formyltransferase
LRVVFLGSGDFARPSFEALVEAGHEVVALVTQPDKPKGRGRRRAPPPLKPTATARGVPVLQPPRINDPAALSALGALRPDVLVVVAYGQILPRAILDLARFGAVNVHASLLPRYRGAAPIQWAIARGETETGVTTMQLDEGLDTGPVLLQSRLTIGPDETAGELLPRLAALGATLLLETLDGLHGGRLVPMLQDPAFASHAPLLRKEDGRLDWSRSALELACRVRAFNPWPGAFTSWRNGRLSVWRARASTSAGPPAPGRLLGREGEGLLVSCGDGVLALLEVQPEGRRQMSGAAFAAGARPDPDARFE